MYRIEFSQLAFKQLKRIYGIEKKLYFRLIAAIETLKTHPFQGLNTTVICVRKVFNFYRDIFHG